MLASLELIVLVTALAGPMFRVRHVEVTGVRRLSAAQVISTAGLRQPGSIFTVDPRTIRHRLDTSTWVRYSTVSTVLPDRVTVHVEEWQPVATFHAGSGARYFVSEQAVALGPTGEKDSGDGLLDIDGPPGSEPRPGRRALDQRLLTALVNIQRALPQLIGQEARAFAIDGCGNVTLLSARGWRAQFGRVLTDEEFATLHDKVAALKAVAPSVDYNSPDLDTVNVMNPAAVGVRTKPKPSPSVLPAGRQAGARPTPAASPVSSPIAGSPSGSAAPVVEVTPCR